MLVYRSVAYFMTQLKKYSHQKRTCTNKNGCNKKLICHHCPFMNLKPFMAMRYDLSLTASRNFEPVGGWTSRYSPNLPKVLEGSFIPGFDEHILG